MVLANTVSKRSYPYPYSVQKFKWDSVLKLWEIITVLSFTLCFQLYCSMVDLSRPFWYQSNIYFLVFHVFDNWKIVYDTYCSNFRWITHLVKISGGSLIWWKISGCRFCVLMTWWVRIQFFYLYPQTHTSIYLSIYL